MPEKKTGLLSKDSILEFWNQDKKRSPKQYCSASQNQRCCRAQDRDMETVCVKVVGGYLYDSFCGAGNGQFSCPTKLDPKISPHGFHTVYDSVCGAGNGQFSCVGDCGASPYSYIAKAKATPHAMRSNMPGIRCLVHRRIFNMGWPTLLSMFQQLRWSHWASWRTITWKKSPCSQESFNNLLYRFCQGWSFSFRQGVLLRILKWKGPTKTLAVLESLKSHD